MSNHLATVKLERAKYAPPIYKNGVLTNPLGFENAWKITNAVAYAHRDEGWGLLKKTGGTQWNNCSIDKIINLRTREAIDCLFDGEGVGEPQWGIFQWLPEFPSLWVAPTSGAPEPPTPPIPPIPPDPPTPPPPIVVMQIASPDGKITAQLNNDGRLVAYKGGVAIWAVIPDAQKK